MEKAEKDKKYKLSFRFVPTQRVINSKKIAKKFKKLNNTILWLHYKPKLVGKRREREKIKIIVAFPSVPTQRVIGNFKKIAKKFEKRNNTIMASFQAKIGWTRPRNRKNTNYHSVPFLHNA